MRISRKARMAALGFVIPFSCIMVFCLMIGEVIVLNHPGQDYADGKLASCTIIGLGLGSIIGTIAAVITYNETRDYFRR